MSNEQEICMIDDIYPDASVQAIPFWNGRVEPGSPVSGTEVEFLISRRGFNEDEAAKFRALAKALNHTLVAKSSIISVGECNVSDFWISSPKASKASLESDKASLEPEKSVNLISEIPLKASLNPASMLDKASFSGRLPEGAWLIDKAGNLALIGRECEKYAGIAIIDTDKNEIVESSRVAKNDKKWREVIAQGVWQTKLQELAGSRH